MKKYIAFGFLLIFCVYNTAIALGSGAFIKKDNAMKYFLKLSKELHRGVKQPTSLDTDLPEWGRSNWYELIETGTAVLGYGRSNIRAVEVSPAIKT